MLRMIGIRWVCGVGGVDSGPSYYIAWCYGLAMVSLSKVQVLEAESTV